MSNASADGRRVESKESVLETGDFHISEPGSDGIRNLRMRVPDLASFVQVGIIAGPSGRKGVWGWNGDEDKPTIDPGFEFYGVGRWRGSLIAGRFVPEPKS